MRICYSLASQMFLMYATGGMAGSNSSTDTNGQSGRARLFGWIITPMRSAYGSSIKDALVVSLGCFFRLSVIICCLIGLLLSLSAVLIGMAWKRLRQQFG